jgi:hypothetical protein
VVSGCRCADGSAHAVMAIASASVITMCGFIIVLLLET